MALKFPDSADSADLAAAGYSQVIILGGGNDSVSTSATADYLILAGGGGGGGVIDGGGGAGGYRASWGTGADGSGGNSGGLSALETALTLASGTAYSITVGQGGEGGLGFNNSTNHRGHKGRTSSISGIGASISTTGGGGGHGYSTATHTERNGGSGGGGSYAVYTGGTGTTGEGFAGGNGVGSNEAGGGGGAGAVGGNASTDVGGDGGVGLASTITGTSITRAGGGGGGSRNQRTPGDGGAGGGGGGGFGTLSSSNYVDGNGGNEAEHGRSQYGGGGGGGGYSGNSNSQIGGSGGSGIAIFRLPSTMPYSASQLASDVSSLSNCTASYLNTQVYTDDTNFSSVNLLLDGSSLTDDLSSVGKNFTSVAGANLLSTTGPYGTTQNVLNFDGVNDYLVETTGSADFKFGTDDFTIEAWLKADVAAPSVVPGVIDYDHSNTGSVNGQNDYFVLHQLSSTRTYAFYANNTSGTVVKLVEASFPNLTDFHHVAITRSGSTVKMFINGVLEDTSTNVLVADMTSNRVAPKLFLGYQDLASRYWNGQMADVRITKGAARYTSGFTAPTSAFPNRETSTGGDHIITFTVATEDAYDGGATTNDGTATWTPTLSITTPVPSTTWTIPDGVDSFSVMAIGAGGAAGYSDSTSAGGGGGGAGLAYLNNIAVAQGSNEVASITVDGGQLGISSNSDGGDGENLTVTMNLSTTNTTVNLSGYNINPYGQDSHDSSFAGIVYVGADRAYDSNIYDSFPTLNLNFDDSHSSTADQFVYVQPPGSFGAAYPFSTGVTGAQTLFEIENVASHNNIKSLAETNPSTTNSWGYNPTTTLYSADSVIIRNIDNTGRNALDSIQYYDSDIVETYFLQNTYDEMYKAGVLGTLDSIALGEGAFTLFRVFSQADAAQFGALPGNSPYVDSNGTIQISSTGDPSDNTGYGPEDLNQILIIKNLTS